MATMTPNTKTDDLKNQVQESASTMTDKAKEIAGTLGDKAKDAASAIGQKAENATHAVGNRIEHLGDTIRDKGPHQGVLGSAASSVASGLESSGKYLQEEGLKGMAEDVTNVIRRNPIPAVLIGVAVGFLIARITTSRS
jgi:ElaB/YqjD/DUF883 family membrane-anchored ribosome-binding protein